MEAGELEKELVVELDKGGKEGIQVGRKSRTGVNRERSRASGSTPTKFI